MPRNVSISEAREPVSFKKKKKKKRKVNVMYSEQAHSDPFSGLSVAVKRGTQFESKTW